MYDNNKLYIGTNTKTRKAKNIKKNSKVSSCIDIGIKSPDIVGIMGIGRAKLILKMNRVELLAEKILLRYFKNLKNQSAQQLLNQTNCVIEITPKKITNWKY
jgi:general stress protein 26